MMRICALVFAWVWLFTINAKADEITDSELRRTLNNVSHEFATCAGFYTLAAICLGEQDQGLTQQSRTPLSRQSSLQAWPDMVSA